MASIFPPSEDVYSQEPPVAHFDTVKAEDVSSLQDAIRATQSFLTKVSISAHFTNVETLNADKTLTDTDDLIQRLDCNGSNRSVMAPAADDDNHAFFLINSSGGAFNIAFKSNDSVTTFATVGQGDAALMIPDGAGGYRAVGISDHGALSGLTDDDHPQYLLATGLRDWSEQSSTPSSPAASKMRLYFKNDDKLYTLNSSGTETEVGAGGGLANAEGVLKNGKIVRTVATNDLTVAIKTLAGADPSAGDPVKVVLNGTEYSITSALSVTITDGTNTFNAGSAQHATQILYLPVHLILRAAGPTVNIGVSRVFGRTYADFSATTTNDHYLAYSGSAPASTDVVVNIGYVSASLSAAAAHLWSIPAIDVAHSIPVYDLPWMDWSPGQLGFSVLPTVGVARYTIARGSCRHYLRDATAGTSNATTFTYELPITAKVVTNTLWSAMAGVVDNGASLAGAGRVVISTGGTQGTVQSTLTGLGWTAASGKRINSMHIMEYET
jgi:hypothetical protein